MPEKPSLSSLFRRSEIEKTTDSCSVCEEEVNFFGMFHHMRVRHPGEFPLWLTWAAATLLAFILPVVGIVLWFIFFGPTNGIIVILVFIGVIVVAEFVVERIGKNWERKVSGRWKAAHPLSSKSQRRPRT